MTNKLVVFDLDGVLVETKMIHYEALNLAISETDSSCQISQSEHLSRFDGLDTRTKLRLLAEDKRLDASSLQKIWIRKQEITSGMLAKQEPNPDLRKVFTLLRDEGFIIAVASNSIRETVESEINRLNLGHLVDFSLSNDDVDQPKPHPEIYWRAMMRAKVGPAETIIFEDSSVGRRAALASGGHLVPVDSPSDVTLGSVKNLVIDLAPRYERTRWKAKNLKILVPMAGAGSRFADAGYTFPKPLIEVRGRAMIEVVVKNLQVEGDFIFLVQRDHYEKFNLERYLNLLAPGSQIVLVDGVTDGAARTALLAEAYIDNDVPLLIANSDQFVDWDSSETLYRFGAEGIDGGLVTFESSHPKWSFAKLDEDGWVTEVAEKQPISTVASTGIYYWSKGSDFVKFAKQMIEKDIRTNGEFYICPVYNEAIAAGRKIRTKSVPRMWGLGTPEDLTTFLSDPTAVQMLTNL